jgi:uncharacterized protein
MNAFAEQVEIMTTATVHGVELQLDHHGAVWWAAERVLVVADMHLEKGSAYASRGQLLPPYDSAATLMKLNRLVARYRPQRLIALGDSFHDRKAEQRMADDVRNSLVALAASLEMIWITGNHDPEIPSHLPGSRHDKCRIGGLVFRHEPQRGQQPGEIAGHLHPAAKVSGPQGRIRRPAFVADGMRMILPAFGAFTGGLNCLEPAIAGLFPGDGFTAHVCGATRVYPVHERRLSL